MKPETRIRTKYRDFVQSDGLDKNLIKSILFKKYGWSLNKDRFDEFERSKHYKAPKNEWEYAEQINKFMAKEGEFIHEED